MSKKLIVGYCRVSSNIQVERDSIQTQEDAIVRFADMHGIALKQIIKDEGVSGTLPLERRVGGKKLLSLIEEGQYSGIICTKLDRLFRSAGEALVCIDSWVKEDVEVFILNFLNNGKALDTRDPSSKMMLGVMAVFAEFERGMISLRTKENMQQRKNNFKKYCSYVYGYKSVNGQLVADSIEQEAIALMFTLKSEGKSLRQITQTLTDKGYPTPRSAKAWYPATVSLILSNSIHQS